MDSLSQMFSFQHAMHVDYISQVTRPIISVLTVIANVPLGSLASIAELIFKNTLLQTLFGLVFLSAVKSLQTKIVQRTLD